MSSLSLRKSRRNLEKFQPRLLRSKKWATAFFSASIVPRIFRQREPSMEKRRSHIGQVAGTDPTDLFTILAPQNPSIDELYVCTLIEGLWGSQIVKGSVEWGKGNKGGTANGSKWTLFYSNKKSTTGTYLKIYLKKRAVSELYFQRNTRNTWSYCSLGTLKLYRLIISWSTFLNNIKNRTEDYEALKLRNVPQGFCHYILEYLKKAAKNSFKICRL